MRVAAVAGYAPRGYITAEEIEAAWGHVDAPGIQQKAVAAHDEDALTMAGEAGRSVLATAGVEPSAVSAVLFATTTPPLSDESLLPRLCSVLGVSGDARTSQFGGSACAGVDALVAGIASDTGPVLVLSADAPRGEPDSAVDHAAGAGAAAVLLTADGDGEPTVLEPTTEAYPGTRFREPGRSRSTQLGITQYDRQAYRETVGSIDAGDVDAAALGAPNGGLPYRAADALGLDTETIRAGAVVHSLGDTGTAAPLLGLAKALDGGAERTLVVGYGSGSEAAALTVEGTPAVTYSPGGERERSYTEYLRARGEITSGEPDGGGAYVSIPSWRRTLPQRHRLVAGRCRDCGTLAFPPEGACGNCGALDAYDSVELSGDGTVEAVTTIRQGGAPPEFVEQQARDGAYASAIVAFDGPEGGAVSVPVQLVETETAAVGDRVTATVRRLYTQEGVPRYGTKARPLEE